MDQIPIKGKNYYSTKQFLLNIYYVSHREQTLCLLFKLTIEKDNLVHVTQKVSTSTSL